MAKFSIDNPYFIVVVCLVLAVVGVTAVTRLPVDMFPSINIPVVVVATFYSGMPAQQIETNITSRFERFFTLASGVEHIESRSLPGVSLIKVYFQPGVDPDAAVGNISNLAMAQLRRLPPGTLPPVVLKFDASSLPVCLVTVKGEGVNEANLRDIGQYTIRNQIASVPGASVPQPFGGKYRQVMIYVDPMKLEAYSLSPMDVVRAVNDSNVILPSGSAKIGPYDYSIFTNSLVSSVRDLNSVPVKATPQAVVRLSDIGTAKDDAQIQYNVVRVDGDRAVYLPILKQGGDTNTISVVDGIRAAVSKLVDVPREIGTKVVFDQAQFVRQAIETLLHEGAIGLILTSLMIMLFLGSFRATVAVFLSIPLSALATFIALWGGGGSVNTMVLGGLALVFSRLIDNSVVVLENIYRHLELAEPPMAAAAVGGREVALPVLAATLTTAVVFFPVVFLYGVSRFLFTALALAVVLALLASYVVAMTVVPLYCSRLLKGHVDGAHGGGFHAWFNRQFEKGLQVYDKLIGMALRAPAVTVAGLLAVFVASLFIYPRIGVAFFPRTDAGQFLINMKAPSGTRVEQTEEYVRRVEQIIRDEVKPEELNMVVSNLGVTPDFSAIYTSNSAPHTAFVQAALHEEHKIGSYEYMRRVRNRIRDEMPQLATFFQSGGLVDAVLNLGLPAPIDVQVSGSNMQAGYKVAQQLANQIRGLRGVSDVFVPQDLDYPALRLEIDRERAGQLGLSQREVVSNIITALSSNSMIAPSFWIDPRSGIDYLLTVQYPEANVRNLGDVQAIPIRSAVTQNATRLDAVTEISRFQAPTEVDHYQLSRIIDVFVGLEGEDLGRVANQIDGLIAKMDVPDGVRVNLRGMVQGMRASFTSFGLGLLLALVLLYLILVAQFKSFLDPILILLAVPTGLTGVLVTLWASGTTLNVQSLMGIVMMVGIVVSNSILIVEFTHRLRDDGMAVREAVALACRIRLRPVLMTSLATLLGLLPMALKLGTGSEAYAPLARAILGGLAVSLATTIFIVPAAYLLVYGRRSYAQ
ncbi:MAG: efflux RND transporter permease subunit [Bryobacterales bacterium]|nr:efflux RND transporter permease subunit [Bryobacterales bacterium]